MIIFPEKNSHETRTHQGRCSNIQDACKTRCCTTHHDTRHLQNTKHCLANHIVCCTTHREARHLQNTKHCLANHIVCCTTHREARHLQDTSKHTILMLCCKTQQDTRHLQDTCKTLASVLCLASLDLRMCLAVSLPQECLVS